ncbi:MAG: ferritin-like domain-containing protein [Chitinophagaceae bacterium]
MNIAHIISEIEKKDPEIYDRLSPRRKVMQQFARTGKKIVLSALPLALSSMFNKAYGRDVTAIADVLQYALKLEYLEAAFYTKVIDSTDIVPMGPPKDAFKQIYDHEKAHVALLQSTITGLGVSPISEPSFDFTAGNGSGNGPFKNVFGDYSLLLSVAQTLEDTGVRAYKGRIADLVDSNDILTVALQIHSVEARHASHIRSMRRALADSTAIKPWITGKDTAGIGAVVQASYNGEESTTQLKINLVNMNGTNISADTASEAFDEPLAEDAVLAIIDPFIV